MITPELRVQRRTDLKAIAFAFALDCVISAVASGGICSIDGKCFPGDVVSLFFLLLFPGFWLALKVRKRIGWPKGAFQSVTYDIEDPSN